MPGPLYVLGPQRPEPTLPAALSSAGGSGPVVLITAGWRHEEADIEPFRPHLGDDAVLLPLYAWLESLLRENPQGIAEHHGRQQQELRRLKALYRLRLAPALQTVRALRAEAPDEPHAAAELEDALGVVRRLDQRFVDRSRQVRARFLDERPLLQEPAVKARCAAAADLVHRARAVLIAGGHVGVLRSRLEFFGMGELLAAARDAGTAIIAWSAGAMALTERVVLFHDEPPIGLSDAELLDEGFGIVPGAVLLPHAQERLVLADPARVGMMARRFAPARCIGLERGAWLSFTSEGVACLGGSGAASHLRTDGDVVPLEVSLAAGT